MMPIVEQVKGGKVLPLFDGLKNTWYFVVFGRKSILSVHDLSFELLTFLNELFETEMLIYVL